MTWMAIAGALLLALALSSAYLRRLPVSTAGIYLCLGLAIGPFGLGIVLGDVAYGSAWFERTTEVALVVSLFVGGLKLRQPLRSATWPAALWLAGPVMLLTIVCVALLLAFGFGLDAASALLLAAILAPTDPVLASAVSVSRAADDDRLRYALSGEAGLNDGLAFPFVLLALRWYERGTLGGWVGSWALLHLLWAIPVGLALGFVLGERVGRVAVWLRSRQQDNQAPTDFLALALIALSYVCAQAIGALGFLAAFAAGMGLRHAERGVVAVAPHPDAGPNLPPLAHPPAEDLVPASATQEHVKEPAIAAGVLLAETLSFGDTAERLLEVGLVVLVGISAARHWDVRALPLALIFFMIIRPCLVALILRRTPTTARQRRLIGWFGVRGIGSLYYVSYSLRHGLGGTRAAELVNLTLSVVAISIVAHGVTAQPLLDRYEQASKRARARWKTARSVSRSNVP